MAGRTAANDKLPQKSWATSLATRRSMQANRSRDTRPELALRRALHALGLRYRVCARPIPQVRRTSDIVFRPARVAVEVRGCFWHGCPEHYRAPSANAAYWAQKIERNRQRDEENARRLREAGWALEVVWEHEDTAKASQRIAALVRARRSAPAPVPPAGPVPPAEPGPLAGSGPAKPAPAGPDLAGPVPAEPGGGVAVTRRRGAARRTRSQ